MSHFILVISARKSRSLLRLERCVKCNKLLRPHAFDSCWQSGATCIIHTASPHANLKDAALYWKVNVDGTKAVIAAAQASGVRKLVFTSSAGVVFNGGDIIGVDERLPYPAQPFDAYNESKAKAEEAVLAANGQGGLLTVALRPAGIFGFVIC
jgi:sterol-4alpha-carboxylate 3-dehydrogenase (decarboxylating)